MLPVSETVSPPVRFSTVMTRTGRISGAGGSAAGLQAVVSRASIEKPSNEVGRAEWTFLPVSERANKGRSSMNIFAIDGALAARAQLDRWACPNTARDMRGHYSRRGNAVAPPAEKIAGRAKLARVNVKLNA